MSNLLDTISTDLLLSRSELVRLLRSAPYRYKVYNIPKRSGKGTRTIAQPAREIKRLQRWAMDNLLADLPVHECAMAYRRGLSIRDNAERHAGHAYLLKMDFLEFFPSLKALDLIEYAARHQLEWTEDEVALMCRLLFWRPKATSIFQLSIGAPSSPLVANILMVDFDEDISRECEERGVVYTRYADDLTFSTNQKDTLRSLEEWTAVYCRRMSSPTLKLNRSKTVHSSRKHRRRVTGLILTNDGGISLGREKKRILRAALHRFSRARLTNQERDRLRGWISFAMSVEPEFVKRMSRHYGKHLLQELLEKAPGES